MTGSTNDSEGHVKDLEIAAYLDRGLAPAQVDRIEDHLSRCAECRENVVKTQELVARSHRPRFIYGGLIVAAAAAVALVAVPSVRDVMRPDVVRSSDVGAGSNTIVAYGPIGEVRGPLHFVWGAAAGALSYRLTVSRVDGPEVWSASVSDTTATLPSESQLQSGASYVWVVDAILRDGGTRSTGLHEFGLTK
jgi:hypothetical protein